MASEEPLKVLLKGIVGLFDCGDHSDLTVTCSSDTYKVHKAIVCPQSEFFRLACRKHTDSGGDFKEAQSGIIDIPSREIEANIPELEHFRWDTDAEDPRCVKLMIHYFYHLDYLEDETVHLHKQKLVNEDFDKTHILKEGLLIDHAKMYAMGDKYGALGLESLALKKYVEAYSYSTAGFANSITVAFTSTIDSDMGLRDVIIEYLSYNLTFYMRKPRIDQIVKDLPLLAHSLLRKTVIAQKETKLSIPKENVKPFPCLCPRRETLRERAERVEREERSSHNSGTS